MSVISGDGGGTSLKSSILKRALSSRENAKGNTIKEVRFETHEDRKVRYVLTQVLEYRILQPYEKFLGFLRSEDIEVRKFSFL